MSDLGTARSLADLLLGASAGRAASGLLDWALACADLAVRTAGRRQDFAGLLADAQPRHWLERKIWQIPGLLSGFSIDAPSGLADDLAADELWQPGVRRAMAAWTLHAMTYMFDRSVACDESMNGLAAHAPTRRQLLRYRWQRLGEELDQAGELPAISALMANLLKTTQSWHAPGLPLYPAFRSEGQNALMPSGLPSPVGAS